MSGKKKISEDLRGQEDTMENKDVDIAMRST